MNEVALSAERIEVMELRANTMLTFMADGIKPFLLSALLKEAGAVEVHVGPEGRLRVVRELLPDFPTGTAWLLSQPEDTDTVSTHAPAHEEIGEMHRCTTTPVYRRTCTVCGSTEDCPHRQEVE